jgi:hypothetical protein
MSQYMELLIEFVLAMMDKLKVINENSYNDFQLKVGKPYHIFKPLTVQICLTRFVCVGGCPAYFHFPILLRLSIIFLRISSTYS